VSIDRAVLFRLATSSRLERAVRAVPRGEDLAWPAASRYVAGRTVEDAHRVADDLHRRGVATSIDQFGELVQDVDVAERVAHDYRQLATSLAGFPHDRWLSIDLSYLGLDIDPPGCADRLATIAQALPADRRIQVGAEDHARADAVM
jgi:proline dehydrogenase